MAARRLGDLSTPSDIERRWLAVFEVLGAFLLGFVLTLAVAAAAAAAAVTALASNFLWLRSLRLAWNCFQIFERLLSAAAPAPAPTFTVAAAAVVTVSLLLRLRCGLALRVDRRARARERRAYSALASASDALVSFRPSIFNLGLRESGEPRARERRPAPMIGRPGDRGMSVR